MKIERRILSIVLVLSLCISLALGVSAVSNFVVAGIYGKLHGSNTFAHGDLLELIATASVVKNPDTAYLKIDTEFYSGDSQIDTDTEKSDRGELSLKKVFSLFYSFEAPLNKIYYAHCVQGGSQSDQGYACYTSADLN